MVDNFSLSLLQTTTSILPLSLLFSFPPPRQSWDIVTSVTSLLGGGRERGERERVPRRGGCQQCNEWRSILSLGQARAFTPRCSPGDTEPRVVARGITGGVLTLGRGGGKGCGSRTGHSLPPTGVQRTLLSLSETTTAACIPRGSCSFSKMPSIRSSSFDIINDIFDPSPRRDWKSFGWIVQDPSKDLDRKGRGEESSNCKRMMVDLTSCFYQDYRLLCIGVGNGYKYKIVSGSHQFCKPGWQRTLDISLRITGRGECNVEREEGVHCLSLGIIVFVRREGEGGREEVHWKETRWFVVHRTVPIR